MGRDASPGMIVVLQGDLGAGKTVFAHGIAEGLEVQTWRGSPTFDLIHEYAGRLPYFHLDVYRVTPEELLDLDLERLLDANGVVAVEWGDCMLEDLLSFKSTRLIMVRLEDAGEDTRRIAIEQ
jgi:tRNA threonylcarbamoyladenosine biosynthesis protein TsaE